MQVLVHPLALVETSEVGEGTSIWAYSHVMDGARVGRNCNIGEHCFIEAGAIVGDNCTVKNGNMIWEGVILEQDVFVGPMVCFTNDRYPRSPRAAANRKRYARKANWLQKTVVQQGASLGAGGVLLSGITVGAYAMVAAGGVVARDVPAHALVRGNPARVAGWVCQCGQPLVFTSDSTSCGVCQRTYQRAGEGIHQTPGSCERLP